MANSIITTVLENRSNSRTLSFDLYGTDGKQLWSNWAGALYDWTLREDAEARQAAFDAGKAVMAVFNAELPNDRHIRIDGDSDLAVFRAFAVRKVNVDNAEAVRLKGLRRLCRYKLGLTDKIDSYTLDMLQAIYDRAGVEYPAADKAALRVDAQVAKDALALIDDDLKALRKDETSFHGETDVENLKRFQRAAENAIANKIEGVLAKSAADIAAEKAARKAAKKARKEAMKAMEAEAGKAAATETTEAVETVAA